jgi:AcrR family transcriptional regulator
MVQTGAAPARQRYHHGDLRRALLEAGLTLAREGGPDAVVLREATRRVGVSPNAAYRHFEDRDALLLAVSSAAQAELAAAIEEECGRAPRLRDAQSVARSHLRGIGSAYVRFALDNPGLFRAAFNVRPNLEKAADPSAAGPSGRTPFELLTQSLDEYVASGLMPASRREGAEFLAWSAVHGFAMLVLDGPLRALPRSTVDALTQQVIDMVDAGFTSP